VLIPAATEECFSEKVERGEKVFGSFNVFFGGSLDIDVRIYGPDGRIVFEDETMQEDSFSFIATISGSYKLCFSNAESTISSKMVSFNLHVGNALAHVNAAKEEHLSPLEGSVIELSGAISGVLDEARYLVQRERFARNTNESTNARIMWWSVFEMIILISLSAWKIFYIRSLFESKGARRY
jgi:hypothetical protein